MNGSGLGNVLVTGGGGFLGTALVRLLRDRGLSVRSLARRDYPHLRELGAEQVQGDIADPGTVTRAVEGCHTVFHTASKAGLWGTGARVLPGERRGDAKPARRLQGQRVETDHLHELAQRRVQWVGYGRRG